MGFLIVPSNSPRHFLLRFTLGVEEVEDGRRGTERGVSAI
jgi:hypothetical protein